MALGGSGWQLYPPSVPVLCILLSALSASSFTGAAPALAQGRLLARLVGQEGLGPSSGL